MIDRLQEWLFPELRRFESRVAGRRALQLARSEALRSRRMIVFGVFAALALIATNQIIKHALAPRYPFLDYARELTFYVAIVAALAFHCRETRKPLRRYLRMDGVPVCVECGHNTTGIEQSTCPECGALLHID